MANIVTRARNNGKYSNKNITMLVTIVTSTVASYVISVL